MRFLIMLVAGGVWLAFAPGAVRAADGVEVLHWWTAGGESQAMDVVRQALRARGIPWRDVPVAGGGGDAAMTVLRARVTSRNAPAAAQVLGFDIVDWAEQRALVDLSAVAEKEHWDAHVPKAIQRFSKHGGVWIAAPINVHTTNWLWINKKALDAAGGKPPENWDELIAVLDAMQANDIIPLAHGGEDWQDATLFEAIVLSLGAEFYKKALIDLDPDALRSGRMTEAFTRLARLRTYVDENFSGREWNLATAMVIQGKAGMQQMGDWAKGEFLGAGLEPGADFVCIRFPGTQGAATFNSDQFVMFEGAKDRQAQFELASTIEDPQVQAAFNVIKGSVPARTDVPDTAFDACGKKGIADVAEADKAGTLLGSMAHGHAVPAAIKNAIFDVVTGHFNGDIATEDAAGELAGAVELAQ
jgi:glucose/mannose transport system substrate-binding protein